MPELKSEHIGTWKSMLLVGWLLGRKGKLTSLSFLSFLPSFWAPDRAVMRKSERAARLLDERVLMARERIKAGSGIWQTINGSRGREEEEEDRS